MKLRPVLLLTGSLGSVPEVLVAYISSVPPAQPLPSDLIIDPAMTEFQGTHLKVISALRLHKLATIHQLGAPARCLGVGSARHRVRKTPDAPGADGGAGSLEQLVASVKHVA